MTDLERFLADSRTRVEACLDELLPPVDAAPARLHEAMRYAMLGGGKRLRPACVLLGARAVGGDEARALPAACALELVHTYSLVHDDLPCMDDDDLRRGRPTVHKAYDDATAVLVGDALLTLAFEVVATSGERAAEAVRILARAAGSVGMVGGQVLDLEAEGRPLDVDGVLAIDRWKTAALFGASFELGGLSGGGDGASLEALRGVGERLGVVFQVVDDLLDRRASAEEMGKATGKDQARGKATLPSLLGDRAAWEDAERRTAEVVDLSGALPQGELIQELARTMLLRSH